MASDIRLRVGNVTALLTLGGTDQQIAQALTRYATSLGIPLNGTPTENLTAVLEHIRSDVKARAKQVQAAEKRVISEATIAAEVEADNPL